MTDWVRREYIPESDEAAVVSMWLKSYAHSARNMIRGAHRVHSPEENAYWREHAPIVECLLERADTYVLCDPQRVYAKPEQPAVILAFACVTPPNVVHYVVVKRDMSRAGFGPEMVRELFGDMLGRACTLSHDLPEMRIRAKVGTARCGVPLPGNWVTDEHWLAKQFLPRRAA